MMRNFIGVLLLALLISCGGNDAPPSPEATSLIFPEENSECITGTSLSETLSQVTFVWSAANHAERYALNVVNLETNVPHNLTTTATSASLSIAKGSPFAWTVTSINSDSDETAVSETWLFYNAGSETTYAPFPAQLVSPESGETVIMDIANEVTLEWAGADVDNDIDTFEVFFSETNPPTTSLGTIDASTMQMSVGVTSGVVYYWKIVTTDLEGNASDSGVFDFKVF
ncbi:hypothetical protein [Allomuricauda sp. NBRC 101325]|uniref:hypothetical protein n=1 Tax=Allomuricauda sp. NBRC 101325 TaxID=1113758 RepID=UPI0024A2DB98|nr:hypothetical protein [Muricauda sp. NBRC 101325]GLU42904.1 hypothetical protein Musp01_05280 [Muricauda sp. NBRC 101325]